MVKKTILSLLVTSSLTVLLLLITVILGLFNEQRVDRHRVSFGNIDGFSGYVTFNASYEGRHTPLRAMDAEVVITEYRKISPKQQPILARVEEERRGGYIPVQFRFVVERIINTRGVYSRPVRYHHIYEQPML